MDSNIEYLGGNLYQAVGGATADLNNAILQDLTTEHVTINGSTNQMYLSANSFLDVAGDGNTVMGMGIDNASVGLRGSGNTVMATGNSEGVYVYSGSNNTIRTGANSVVNDNAAGDMITVGANSSVYVSGTNTTVNAGQGGYVLLDRGVTGASVSVNNGRISDRGSAAKVTGSTNQIDIYGDGTSHALDLSGSGNTIDAHLGTAPDSTWSMSIATAVDSLTVQTDGSITLKGGIAPSTSLSGGHLTEQLANGNVVSLDGVYSGVTLDYIDASGTKTSTTLMDTNLTSLGGSMYEVTGDANAKMNNTIFSVDGGVNLQLAGNADQMYLNSAAKVNILGNGNTVIGSSASGAFAFVTGGTNNVVALGANGAVTDYGSGDTLTVGAGSSVYAYGSNTTINARQGAQAINFTGAGTAIINGSNVGFVCLAGHNTVQINGSGNSIVCRGDSQITLGVGESAVETIALNGSNNRVDLGYWLDGNTQTTVTTSTNSLTQQADGTLVLQGDLKFGSVSLNGDTATVQMGGGNVLTIEHVAAGTALESIDASGHATWSTLQAATQQLVGAMAAYAPQSTGVGASFETHAMNDSQNMLVASH